MAQIYVGLIGAGLAGDMHARALKQVADITISAVATQHAQTAADFSKKHGISNSYGDYRQLLSDPKINAVHICSPNALHYQQVLDALQAGKHVLCDKPLAISPDQAQEMLTKANQAQLRHGLCSNYRHQPMIQYARHLLQSGELGVPVALWGGYLQSSNAQPSKGGWKADPALIGPSYVVGDLGHHWLDCVSFVLNQKIRRVRAQLQSLLHCPPQVENHALVTCEFDPGVIAQAVFSKVAIGHDNGFHFEIAGHHGSLVWQQQAEEELILGAPDGSRRIVTRGIHTTPPDADVMALPRQHREGWVSGFINLFHHFYSHVSGKQPIASYPTFEDGLYLARVIDAILQSHAQQGMWVEIAA